MCNRYRPARAEIIEAQWQLRPSKFWKIGIGPFGEGPFIRLAEGEPELAVGQWALIGDGDKKPNNAPRMTNNVRWESVLEGKRTFKGPWLRQQRCLIPAETYDEPYYAERGGKSVWWQFRRADGQPWHLAGLWNRWTDPSTGEQYESYSMFTVNCDSHPLLSRFHKHDETLPADRQDKRTVVPLKISDFETWLSGSNEEASQLLRPAAIDLYADAPA